MFSAVGQMVIRVGTLASKRSTPALPPKAQFQLGGYMICGAPPLNHVSGHKAGVAGIYNRATYEKEKRQALSVWAERLSAIVSGRSSTVVAIKGRTRRGWPTNGNRD